MNKAKIILLAAAIACAGTHKAQTFDWGFSLGTATSYEMSSQLLRDADNNLVIMPNIYSQGINLNPLGTNPSFLQNWGWITPMLTYNQQGELIGKKELIDFSVGAMKIASDNSRYVWGNYNSSNVNISLGNSPYYVQMLDSTSQHPDNRFIAKYDAAGNVVWAKNFAFDIYMFNRFNIGIDAAGNFYLGGSFGEAIGNIIDVDFDPTVYNLTCEGERDLFVAKYDANDGHLHWSFNIGVPPQCWTGNCAAYEVNMEGMIVDDAGNIYTAANFGDRLDIDPNPNNVVYLNEPLLSATALLKYDTDGNLVWGQHIGHGDGRADFRLVGRGDNGDLFMNFWYSQNADLDPSANVVGTPLTGCAGCYNTAVIRYDQNGNYLWNYNQPRYEIYMDVFPANNGEYFIHYWTNNLSADTTLNVDIINNAEPCRINNEHSALVRYDANNNFISVWRKNYQTIKGLIIDAQDNIFITGENSGAGCNYDWQGDSTINLPYYGQLDAYLAKFSASTTMVAVGESENTALAIFPNPSHNLVNIQLLEPSTIQFFNLNGQLLSTETVETATLHTISITDLPQAVYTVKIISQSGKIYSQKLVKY